MADLHKTDLHKNMKRPPALRMGDTVGVIAPAGPIDNESLQAGCTRLRSMGYNVVYDESITDRDLYFAGSLQRRLDEFHNMFRREDVRAIVCARGGYGCNYLLPEIDLELLRSHPKIFVGYSDITSLLTYLVDAAGLITFHGPMVTKDFAHENGIDFGSWQAAVGEKKQITHFEDTSVTPVIRGYGHGRLYGGCLSLLAASLGTPYEICTDGTILFLEDLAERPYQVDRMLMQLKLAGKLDGVRGIVFGSMKDCEAPGCDYTLQQVATRIVGDLGVPVAYGLRSGHVDFGNVTLPIGAEAVLQVQDDVRLSWEPAVAWDTPLPIMASK